MLIADFLAGDCSRLVDEFGDSEDILATKRCLRALNSQDECPVLDCGASGSTRRFLSPVAAALGKHPIFKTSGRLAERPQRDYEVLHSGTFELPGDVSSQFVTGLLLALPLVTGDSQIRFSSPLQSRGYVELTLQVLAGAGIEIKQREKGFEISGGQVYHAQPQTAVEGDWSSAAVWLAMNALGSEVQVEGLNFDSLQPDRAIVEILPRIVAASAGEEVIVEVSNCPDLFPVLTVVAGASRGTVVFSDVKRLRFKETDRIASMLDVLHRFGVHAQVENEAFTVIGRGQPLSGGSFAAFGDHRVAMAIAVGATVANSAVILDDPACVAKSYPTFFADFNHLAGFVV